MADDVMRCDVLVVGAGMSGLTAAGAAAESGAHVVVVDAARDVGGSAAMSGGYVWRLDGIDEYARIDPAGDRALQQIIVDEYGRLIDHVRATGAAVTERQPVMQGHGHQVDLPDYFRRSVRAVQAAGGHVVLGASVERLLRVQGRVTGAVISEAGAEATVSAGAVLLATGGFAQSARLRGELISAGARDMRARCADCHGVGLQLARGAGAGTVTGRGFYGHLVGAGVDLSRPEIWDQLTLLHSRAGWLYNTAGERFTDESEGDNISAEAVAAQPGMRALLVWDDVAHRETVLVAWPAGNSAVDRFEVAVALGAPGRPCGSEAEVAAFAAEQGFGTPTLPDGRREGPYRALVVEPAITFPFAGIRIDPGARVLDETGVPIPGLFAAGVDVGGVYARGYGGGLSLGGTTGLRAARSMADALAVG